MGPDQREARGAVVERIHVRPSDGVVTLRTVGDWELLRITGVGRIVRLVVGGQVATGIAAIRGLDGQSGVVVVQVALRAGYAGVRIGQRKSRVGVIEGGIGPTGRIVALRTQRHREAGSDVVRYVAAHRGGAVPVVEVATGVAAVGGLNVQGVVVVDMAGGTGGRIRRNVHAGQCEAGDAMVEGTQVRPGDSVVTLRAVRCSEGAASALVWRIVGLLPVSKVAAGIAAIGGCDLQVVIIVDVALRAGDVGVAIG